MIYLHVPHSFFHFPFFTLSFPLLQRAFVSSSANARSTVNERPFHCRRTLNAFLLEVPIPDRDKSKKKAQMMGISKIVNIFV